MKISDDCIKEVMSVLEEQLKIKHIDRKFFFEPIRINRLIALINKDQKKYSAEEIVYSILQIILRGYVVTSKTDINDGNRIDIGDILYITPKGHEFISSEGESNAVMP